MKSGHYLVLVFAAAIVLGLSRELAGLVAVLVAGVGAGAAALAVGSACALFRVLGALGSARRLRHRVEAAAAALLVLAAAPALVVGWLYVGIRALIFAVDRASPP